MIFHLFFIIYITYLLGKFYSHIRKSSILNTKTQKGIKGEEVFDIIYDRLIYKKSLIERINQAAKKYGPIYANFLGPFLRIRISSGKYAKSIMKDTDFKKFNIQKLGGEYVEIFLGKENILMSDGETWKKFKNVMDPGFYSLENYHLIMDEKIDLFFDEMKKGKDIVIDNLTQKLEHLTLDIMGKSFYGYEFNSMSGKMTKYLGAYDFLLNKLFNPWFVIFPFLKKFKFLGYVKQVENSLEIMNELIFKLIDETIKKFEKNEHYKPKFVIDFMVKSSLIDKSITKEELRANAIVLFFAGHDTTTSALSFAIYNLALHPNIQKKCREEIINHMRKDNIESINHKTGPNLFKKLTYVNAFLKENLRLNNPTIALGREAKEDTSIGHYKIPKGTQISISICSIHRDKKIFENPDELLPERWLTDDKSKLKEMNDNFFAFGHGKRICLGKNFSMLEQMFVISKLLTNFDVINENQFKSIEYKKFDKFVLLPIENTIRLKKVNLF